MLPNNGNGFGPGTSLYGLGAASVTLSNEAVTSIIRWPLIEVFCWTAVAAAAVAAVAVCTLLSASLVTVAACGHVAYQRFDINNLLVVVAAMRCIIRLFCKVFILADSTIDTQWLYAHRRNKKHFQARSFNIQFVYATCWNKITINNKHRKTKISNLDIHSAVIDIVSYTLITLTSTIFRFQSHDVQPQYEQSTMS